MEKRGDKMLFVLKSGDVNPDPPPGGHHQAYGEKQPNVCNTLEKAKKYKSKQAAINAMKRINEYAFDYLFYIEECTGYNG